MSLIPLRWSHLKNIQRSPKHYRHALAAGIVPTKAMRIGGYVNSLTIGGPHRFVEFDGRRQGKKWEEFEAAQEPGVDIVNATEAACSRGIAESLLSSPWYQKLLRGNLEQRMEWTLNGRLCAGTPDAHEPGVVLADLKVTADANPDRFVWHAIKMGWIAQLAWYNRHVEAEEVYLLVAEAKPPFDVVPWRLTPETLLQGTKTWRLLFEKLMACEASDSWPGYTQTILPLEVPQDVELEFSDDEETE